MPSRAGSRSSARAGRQRGEGTREAILDAATELFARHGFDGATISAIASGAGVNRALIAYHFRNKAGLYDAIVQSAVDEAAEALGQFEILAGEPDLERRLVQAFADVYRRRPHFAPMIAREVMSPGHLQDPEAGAKLAGFLQLTERVLKSIELRPEARRYDPQIVHLICVGALIYFVMTSPFRQTVARLLPRPVSTPSLDEFVAVLSDFMSRALRP